MAWVKFFRRPGGNLGKAYQPGSMMSLAPTKGLLNEPGQNSCFLNSAVQVLWQLDIFRRSLRQLPNHYCLGEACIFCALKVIFSQFQDSRERALPSDNLRHALAETFKDEQRFQLGFMDDAAECFENILQRIHLHISPDTESDACTSKFCITHQKFAMTLYEQSVCRSCGASSDPLPFTELVHYVSIKALCQQFFERRDERLRPDMFGELLQAASTNGDLRSCPSKCGQKIKIRSVLMNSPEIVTIGFVWDSEQSDLTEEVIRSLSPHLSLSGLFYHIADENAKVSELQLVAMICYSSKHYCTFAFHTKSSKWVFFDDATVKEVGSKWKDVVIKCIRGHFQPLLLFYSNPEGSAVKADEAAKTSTTATLSKIPENKEIPAVTPQSGIKKLELTRENLTALLSGHGTLKQKSQPLSAFKRGTNHTSGGRGPVKLTTDPTNFLREVAREARNINLIKKDSNKSQERPETPRHKDTTTSERSYSRSLSPPENGFNSVESRLYSSQGRGPTRTERSPRPITRTANAPRSHSQPHIPIRPPSSQSTSKIEFSSGYDTDSSRDSREQHKVAPRSRPNRAWKPMREALNVDSILNTEDLNRLLNPSQPNLGQKRANLRVPYETRSSREDSKPKSLMTIYEDEQRHELGSRNSLESEENHEKERNKSTFNNFTIKNENGKMHRMESGYESSDWLSNGSASLDSPVVDNSDIKEQRRVPESYSSRDPDIQHHDGLKSEISQTSMPFGYFRRKSNDVNSDYFPRENWKSNEKTEKAPEELNNVPSSAINKASNSNVLTAPSLIQKPFLVHHQTLHSISKSSPPLLPPKPQIQKPEQKRDEIQDSSYTKSKSPVHKKTSLSGSSPETLLENFSEPTKRSSSDSSSKSGSSDQERNDLSASENEDKGFDVPQLDSSTAEQCSIPSTYFSVDSCMTDTYRAKYHKKRTALHMNTDSKSGDQTSSGESDHGDRSYPASSNSLHIPEVFRTKKEAHNPTKPTAKWNPISFKGVDEHGFI